MEVTILQAKGLQSSLEVECGRHDSLGNCSFCSVKSELKKLMREKMNEFQSQMPSSRHCGATAADNLGCLPTRKRQKGTEWLYVTWQRLMRHVIRHMQSRKKYIHMLCTAFILVYDSHVQVHSTPEISGQMIKTRVKYQYKQLTKLPTLPESGNGQAGYKSRDNASR